MINGDNEGLMVQENVRIPPVGNIPIHIITAINNINYRGELLNNKGAFIMLL